jgi:hypothetical protein
MLGFGLLAARLAAYGARAGATTTKTAVQTLPKAAKPTGWGAYVKTGVVGGSIGAAGLGLSEAIGSAEESIQEGGSGVLVVGGVIIAIILFLFLILRRK